MILWVLHYSLEYTRNIKGVYVMKFSCKEIRNIDICGIMLSFSINTTSRKLHNSRVTQCD